MIHITMAESSDLVGIIKIDKEVLGNESRKESLKKAIEEERCLVIKRNSIVIGYLIYHTHFFENSFISLVVVDPLERKKGYAKLMMKHFESISPNEKIFSSTNHSNEKMQKVFLSLGYVKSGYVENLDEGDPEIIYFKLVERYKNE